MSVSLWRLGAEPDRAARGGRHATRARRVGVAGGDFFADAPRPFAAGRDRSAGPPQPRLGYAFTSPGLTGRYVVYAESARCPANRRSRFQSTSSFADLHYALYLGSSQRPEDLLVTDLKNLPIRVRHASISIPFGNNSFTFVVTARRRSSARSRSACHG